MNKIIGFNEEFGTELEKIDYIDTIMKDVAIKYGYSGINVPILEDARSYSEELVGNSPWPEWNEKGCFFFEITNYNDSYNVGENQKVILIPEGTVSVTRWLANRIDSQTGCEFPIKLFYSLNCYRNEIISTLTQNKRREFKQFGLEILGSSSIQSDAEILYIIGTMLTQLGVHLNQIRIRLNDIRIFSKLVEESNISTCHSLMLKELLDEIAEARAGKHTETLDDNISIVYSILDEYHLSNKIMNYWKCIVEHKDYSLSGIADFFDDTYKEYFELLLDYKIQFEKIGLKIDIDPCVIRSHEYYTGLSFEVDVITESNKYIEIAGGGRYDRLVGRFLNNKNDQTIPCTGFAFGTERVLGLIKDLNCFKKNKSFTRQFNFNSLVPKIYLPDSSVKSYVVTVSKNNQFPIDIVFDENNEIKFEKI